MRFSTWMVPYPPFQARSTEDEQQLHITWRPPPHGCVPPDATVRPCTPGMERSQIAAAA